MSLAVHCKDLHKIYGYDSTAVHALRGVNLDVKERELLMLAGPSGSGKTTLLSIISGILHYEDGICEVLQTNLGRLSETEKTLFRKKNIGFVFQQFNLIPMLNCLENASVPLILGGMDENKALEKAKEFLEKVGLKERLEAYPAQLSGGEKQRVAIVRAFIHTPKLIICDEPTSSLDHETGSKVMEVLCSFVKEYDTTLVVVSHDDRIYHFAHRLLYMEDGIITSKESLH